MSSKFQKLQSIIKNLSETQINFLENLANIFQSPYQTLERNPESDLIRDNMVRDFGDYLRIHHCFSHQPFTKDKFEFALETVVNLSGVQAKLAPKGNPGYDIEINKEKISLKTQADKNIKELKIHISKFMELGKGEWGDQEEQLIGLREQFFQHLKGYNRIIDLRCLQHEENSYRYELVEIPVKLLQKAKKGTFRMMHNSTQFPKPGYCDVYGPNQKLLYQLYFDGGGERKLQIKNIDKNHCIVHATWSFQSTMI
ncbi:MAG: restriction endonuclease [SAR324 cluster bacterium]|uniref:Restriction endonuclease n=1 Tax=SAR324 cluster bacterium TaxID=2024889 RepID=A0A2A4SXV0_9DELT|nr:MAG: restriction endonuclease [SAR324 cluster bacterium]